MKVRIKDIAARANVSIGTVDRVLHDRGEVSPDTRKKILMIIHELNYEPDILARFLKTKKKYNIAVIIPSSEDDNVFWKYPLEGIREAVKEISHFGFSIREYLFNQFDKFSFINNASSILREIPDAVILAPVFYRESIDFLDRCTANRIPFLLINSNIEHNSQLCFIGQDSERSGQLAGHLISYGLQPGDQVLIVSIAREKDNYNHIIKREKGFQDFFREKPQYNRVEILKSDIEKASDRLIFDRLSSEFDKHKNLTGIFVTNSRVYKVAHFRDKKNISDIKLIGYDLIDENIHYLQKGLIDFLISQKPAEQGYRGIMNLFNHLVKGRDTEPEIYLPIDIITSENLKYYTN